jgi:hypothetical protein
MRDSMIRQISLPIRGAHFRGRGAEDAVFEALNFGRGEVRLEPDDDNQHDASAVKIMVDGVHVGYAPRENAADVRRWLHSGAITSAVTVVDPWNISFSVEEDV